MPELRAEPEVFFFVRPPTTTPPLNSQCKSVCPSPSRWRVEALPCWYPAGTGWHGPHSDQADGWTWRRTGTKDADGEQAVGRGGPAGPAGRGDAGLRWLALAGWPRPRWCRALPRGALTRPSYNYHSTPGHLIFIKRCLAVYDTSRCCAAGAGGGGGGAAKAQRPERRAVPGRALLGVPGRGYSAARRGAEGKVPAPARAPPSPCTHPQPPGARQTLQKSTPRAADLFGGPSSRAPAGPWSGVAGPRHHPQPHS